jgi:serine/threonine-protein kinase RsbW
MTLNAEDVVIDDMQAAVDEAAANIIVHGYQGQPGNIEIEVWKEGEALVVRLRDQAPLFDPTTVPPPDLTLPLEERFLGGLGIHLIRHFTDTMTHRVTSEGGNELTLMKKVT